MMTPIPDRILWCYGEYQISQIMALAHQIYPQRAKYFLEAYTAATARPHGYLVIDMKQETPDILRLRSHIFPGEEQKAYADI
jgi:hypothetical protein